MGTAPTDGSTLYRPIYAGLKRHRWSIDDTDMLILCLGDDGGFYLGAHTVRR